MGALQDNVLWDYYPLCSPDGGKPWYHPSPATFTQANSQQRFFSSHFSVLLLSDLYMKSICSLQVTVFHFSRLLFPGGTKGSAVVIMNS